MIRTALVLTALLGLVLPASGQTTPTASLAAEADVLAYGISGYWGIFSVTLPNKLQVAFGVGAYDAPSFLVSGPQLRRGPVGGKGHVTSGRSRDLSVSRSDEERAGSRRGDAQSELATAFGAPGWRDALPDVQRRRDPGFDGRHIRMRSDNDQKLLGNVKGCDELATPIRVSRSERRQRRVLKRPDDGPRQAGRRPVFSPDKNFGR